MINDNMWDCMIRKGGNIEPLLGGVLGDLCNYPAARAVIEISEQSSSLISLAVTHEHSDAP